ncbi:hypothetical protein [Halopenitus sp. POP-27]|uniref:hypothetical protein n=1 Tax=Halopenitus sp. POP-27 TaxID=2994425 RepID=UPI0024694985|nr:hypothetical protein [Halopenitus sp. POP-27]
MSDTTFHFAEWDITGVLTDITDLDRTASHEDLIREAIIDYIDTTEPVTETDDSRWHFGDYEEEVDRVYGKFGKVYTDDPVTYDADEGDFVESDEPNIDADYSVFMLHFDLNLLVYNTKNRVGHQQFRKRFAEGFAGSTDNSAQFNSRYVYNTQSIEYILDETTVREANFELEPSNPENEDEWEDLDESIQQMLADKFNIDAESAQGLNFDEEFIAQALAMSQTDYGEYRLKYDEDGTVRIRTSDGEPVRSRQERPESIGGIRAMSAELINYVRPHLTRDGE